MNIPIKYAVIGVACRFPGASDPKAFWELLEKCGDGLFQGELDLAQNFKFSSSLFGLEENDHSVSTQQRLLLEATYELFENAFIPLKEMQGKAIGVFVSTSDESNGEGSNPLVSASGAAGRISHTFDLRGPSITVQ